MVKNHLASDYYQKCLLKTGIILASKPGKQDIKHRANHPGAVLFLSINTCKQRVNHSSAILWWGMSKK